MTFDTGILLVPAQMPTGFAGGNVMPLSPVPPVYAVSGMLLANQPYIATAPLVSMGTLCAGDVFTLLFRNPSSATQSALADGATALLTFALFGGALAYGSVRLASATVSTRSGAGSTTYVPRAFGGTLILTSGGVLTSTLLVTVTLLHDIPV